MFLCFFFKQKTAYEVRISDWSSDVCSSDLLRVSRCISCCVVCLDGCRVARARASGAGSCQIRSIYGQKGPQCCVAPGPRWPSHAALQILAILRLSLDRKSVV